jgi:hypothetical protein
MSYRKQIIHYLLNGTKLMTLLNHASKGLLAMFALTGTFVFSSCSDDDDTTVKPDATVKIINVLPDAGGVDVYNGTSKINSSTIAYGEATDYKNVADGDQTFEFKNGAGNTILTAPLKFDGGNYSLIATGTTDDNATTHILAKDDLGAPASGKAKIRFIHASTNGPAVNFLLNDSLLVANTAYKGATEFKEMAAGTYTIRLHNATNGEAVIAREGVVLQAGKIYTVLAQGLVGATPILEQPFAVNVLANK